MNIFKQNVLLLILIQSASLSAINFIHAQNENILSSYSCPAINQDLWENWNNFPTAVSYAEWNEMRLCHASHFILKKIKPYCYKINQIESAMAMAARHFRYQIIQFFSPEQLIPEYLELSQTSRAIILSLRDPNCLKFFGARIKNSPNNIQILIDQLLVPLAQEVALGVENAYYSSRLIYFGSLQIFTAKQFRHVYEVATIAAKDAAKQFLDCLKLNVENFSRQVLSSDLGLLLTAEPNVFLDANNKHQLQIAATLAVEAFLQGNVSIVPPGSLCAVM